MNEYNLNWTAEELKLYFLLFLNNIGVTHEVLDLTRMHTNDTTYHEILNEFKSDNDYQSIQKICTAVETKNYSKSQLHGLVEDVKKRFTKKEKKYNNLLNNQVTTLERILVKSI